MEKTEILFQRCQLIYELLYMPKSDHKFGRFKMHLVWTGDHVPQKMWKRRMAYMNRCALKSVKNMSSR